MSEGEEAWRREEEGKGKEESGGEAKEHDVLPSRLELAGCSRPGGWSGSRGCEGSDTGLLGLCRTGIGAEDVAASAGFNHWGL